MASGHIKEVRPNFHESLDTGGQIRARKSFETAKTLLKAVKAKIAERNPQIGLD